MASVLPFKALRPQPQFAKQVASRPYDVLNSAEAKIEARGNPNSFLHITKSEIDLSDHIDIHSKEVYDRARENLRAFIQRGVLFQESKPCYYIYQLIMKLPPFTLQTMVENTIRSNRMSKEQPLRIHLYIDDEQRLCFMNSNQPKIGIEDSEPENGLQNISNQYRLLAKQELEIRETTDTRIIRLPLINDNEIVAA